MNYTRGRVSTSILVLFLIVFLLIGAGAFWFANWRDARYPLRTPEEPVADSGWGGYQNDEFGFYIEYPSDWAIAVLPNDPIAPVFNIYKPAEGITPPFTHHNNVTQVSIFPQGVPAEGVFGDTLPGDPTLVPQAGEVRSFVLDDGTLWATVAVNLTGAPGSWNEAGFLWASARVDNLAVTCERNGEPLPEDECDPFIGDAVVRSGAVLGADRAIEERILKSFRFE